MTAPRSNSWDATGRGEPGSSILGQPARPLSDEEEWAYSQELACRRCKFDRTLRRVLDIIREEGFADETEGAVRFALTVHMRREFALQAGPVCEACKVKRSL